MKIIAIDPGKEGGLAMLNYDLAIDIYTTLMPLSGKEIYLAGIINWLRNHIPFGPLSDEIDFVIIEKVGAMPRQGVVSMFSFGFSTGAMHGLMAGLGIPIRIVHPRTWKAKILAGTDKSKNAAVNHVRRAYPKINLYATPRCKKPHLGIVDAICIAEYGWREFGKTKP